MFRVNNKDTRTTPIAQKSIIQPLVQWKCLVLILLEKTYPFKRQSHKMVKPTQTIRRQNAGKLFECV